jgi:acetate kinase
MSASVPPILVINTGSSSLKFSVLDVKAEVVLSSGIPERIGKNSDVRITPGSGLLCLVIPTNEELMIARETDRLVS